MSDTKPAASVIKRVANAELYSDGMIIIRDVRLSYPHVFVPHAGEDGGTPKFSVVGLMPKKTHAEARSLLVEVSNKLITEKNITVPADKKFYRNGEDEEGRERKPGYKGHWTVSAREERRPLVLGRNGKPLNPSTQQAVIYGGCWGNIMIRPWVQNNSYGKRLNAGLSGVQFVRDDEAFGEGRISEDEVSNRFGSVAGEDSGYSDGLGAAAPDDDDI